jgi:hypothetical protein
VPYDHPEVLATHAQYKYGPLFYVATFALAFWSATASLVVNLATAIFFAIPPARETSGRAGGPQAQGAVE